MQTAVPLACFLSVIRPPGVQYENSLLQIAPVDKSKCPYVKDGNDVAFQLFTRHNPTVYQQLKIDDDEKLFASSMDFHDKTVLYFHAWMETPEDGSGIMVREAYMQRGDTNVIMVDARSLQAGPWYFTAAQNTWYIGRFAGQFIDYLVTRGLNLNNTHLVGHSLGAHVAGVAGSALKSGKVARITGLDAALPLFDNLPLHQRLDPTDAHFVDTIHTDSGIFGYKMPIGHVDFYPNAGISPQPGCELEVVIPQQMLLNKCDTRTQTNGFFTYYLKGKGESTFRPNSLEDKLERLFTFIQAVRANNGMDDSKVTMDKVKANIESLYDFKDSIVGYLKDYNDKKTDSIENYDKRTENVNIDDYMTDYDDEYDDKKMKSDKNEDATTEYFLDDKKADINQTLGDEYKEADIEDQIAEESDFKTNAEIDEVIIHDNDETVKLNEDKFELKIRKKRQTDLLNLNSDVELTVVSGHLTINKDKGVNDTKEDFDIFKSTTTESTAGKNHTEKENSKAVTKTLKLDANSTVGNSTDDFEISLDDGHEEIEKTNVNKKESKPFKFNLFRRRPILRQIIRVIPIINRNKKDRSKTRPQFSFLNKNKNKIDYTAKLGSKFRPNIKKNILKRQKRFLPFFQRSEDSNNILFRMLDFLIKNRKNVLPVFTVMREINTLVKSGNGELNHVSKESNNYIGATPPVFTPITYNLELGNENRVMAFVKKLFGVIPKGDRLTINGK